MRNGLPIAMITGWDLAANITINGQHYYGEVTGTLPLNCGFMAFGTDGMITILQCKTKKNTTREGTTRFHFFWRVILGMGIYIYTTIYILYIYKVGTLYFAEIILAFQITRQIQKRGVVSLCMGSACASTMK